MSRFVLSLATLLALFVLYPSLDGFSKDTRGKVIGVADGDTITILDANKRQHKIRLYGIDSPESGQAFGNEAKRAVSDLLYNKKVEVNVLDIDRYGRSVGIVFHNNVNINGDLIKQGYAWLYPRYCKVRTCDDWLVFEEKARIARIGLWADPHPLPPWEWRAKQRNTAANKATVSIGAGSYHGNVRSHVFHAPGCKDYNCKNCIKQFNSITEAKQAGYRPHQQCVN